MSEKKLAIVMIRGFVHLHPDIKKTLEFLRLGRKHVCVVLEDNAVNRGMLQKVKDFTTYGTIDEAFFATMIEKRGETVGQEDVKVDAKKIAKEYFSGKVKLRDFETNYKLKPFFRLHPPIGGFERKGIKMAFAKGGVLGPRGDLISVLITKML